MHNILGLLSIFDSGSYSSGAPGGTPTGSVPILIILAVIGASYINGMAGRTRYLDSAVSVAAMLVGGFAANAMFAHVRLPFDNEALVAAIVGLGGMTVSGLMLLFTYKRSEF